MNLSVEFQLKQDTTLMLKRYEVDKNWVHLYFDKVCKSVSQGVHGAKMYQ